MSRKVLFFDVETTGIDALTNDIVQLSGMIEIDGKIEREFNFKMQPLNWMSISPDALKVTGNTVELLKTFEKPDLVFDQFCDVLGEYVNKFDKNDKFYPAGYNVKFDLDFLQGWFRKMGDKYGTGTWQNWKAIDPLPILQFMDAHQMIALPNYKLQTVCEHFGIEIKAHDALSDIKATMEVIAKVRSFITYAR